MASRHRGRFIAVAVSALAAFAGPEGRARAQQPSPPPLIEDAPQQPYRFRFEWYDGVDLGLLAADGIALGVVGVAVRPNPSPIIGPDRAGKAYKDQDAVPMASVAVGMAVLGTTLILSSAEVHGGTYGLGWDRRTYDTAIGLADAMLMTLAATESLKRIIGRPRPDYEDRVRRGIAVEDGRQSFPSGHTSSSFAFANYASLVIGGAYVWGDTATPASRVFGVAAQAALFTTAGFVGMSRFYDERHNPSDIWAGALLGLALSNVAYWRRFDRNGRPRRWKPEPDDKRAPGSTTSIDVVPVPGGLGVSGRF